MDRIKKIVRIIKLVLLGAKLARLVIDVEYKLRTCRGRPSTRHIRVPRPEKGTGSRG